MAKFFLVLAVFLLTSKATSATSLSELKRFWHEKVATTCEGYPSKESCDDGDSTIFNGLLCLSGLELGCSAVRESQDADGRFWRSPRRKRNLNFGEKNSFSRDQAMGVLAYLARTKDREAATRWLGWIEANRPCSVKNPFNGKCSIKGTHRLCRGDKDEVCTITPIVWSMMGRVWRYLDISRHELMKRYEGIESSDPEVELVKRTKAGYRLHLKAIQSHIRNYMGQGITSRIMKVLLKKEGDNPYFRYVAYGPTSYQLEKVKDLCPNQNDDIGFRRFQWAWERATASEAWLESMGWDCIFMANLLEQVES